MLNNLIVKGEIAEIISISNKSNLMTEISGAQLGKMNSSLQSSYESTFPRGFWTPLREKCIEKIHRGFGDKLYFPMKGE